MRQGILALVVALGVWSTAGADSASRPGELKLERPTIRCLGVHWRIAGDANANATATLEVRQVGHAGWRRSLDLFRVASSAVVAHRRPPEGTSLLAGSVFDLVPDTQYELRVTLIDPDGGGKVVLRRARTRKVPVARPVAGGRILHVVPGGGGGSGAPDDPFGGLAAADKAARPGDFFHVHKGVYRGTWKITSSGEKGKPIIWSGWIDRQAVIDAKGDDAERPERAVSASDLHDVWLDGLTIRNAKFLVVCHRSRRMALMRCNLHGCEFGFTCTASGQGQVAQDCYVADNTFVGPSTWPRAKGIENARGIQVTGLANVICHNRVRGFADGIDTFGGPKCSAIDIYNNDISEMTDDGIEMDYSQRNCRCFRNRLTNVYQGVSTQPLHGGPCYILRNTMYNVSHEVFKMHNSPSGALMLHNTSVKRGGPVIMYGSVVRNSLWRNNLFIGTAAGYALEAIPPLRNCDFDYDGFGGGPFRYFLKANAVRYKTVNDVWARSPIERHCVVVEPKTCFASGLEPPRTVEARQAVERHDLRLAERSQAVDRGVRLWGINDSFAGKAPDLGAFEYGAKLPHYGPRGVDGDTRAR